jgi:hypothetical protein
LGSVSGGLTSEIRPKFVHPILVPLAKDNHQPIRAELQLELAQIRIQFLGFDAATARLKEVFRVFQHLLLRCSNCFDALAFIYAHRLWE